VRPVLAILKTLGVSLAKTFAWAIQRPVVSAALGLGAILVAARAKRRSKPVRAALAASVGQAFIYTAIAGFIPGLGERLLGWLLADRAVSAPTPLAPAPYLPPWIDRYGLM